MAKVALAVSWEVKKEKTFFGSLKEVRYYDYLKHGISIQNCEKDLDNVKRMISYLETLREYDISDPCVFIEPIKLLSELNLRYY